MPGRYRSSIPKSAKEHIQERYPNQSKKKAEYRLNREVVGVRFFHEDGQPSMEWGVRKGKQHGMMYRWDVPGLLLSAEPYFQGLSHGTAKQWSDEGRLIGTYRMKYGTGIDLWWQDWSEGIFLHEVHYLKNGMPHGYEWWINDDQRTVWHELHWEAGNLHGIERMWNDNGRLKRGYPKYYVRGQQVTGRAYLNASKRDRSLPHFKVSDNQPTRMFPPEITTHLHGGRKKPSDKRSHERP